MTVGDFGHLAGRIPPGQGLPGGADRRHQAGVAAQRYDLAARVFAEAVARGDEGAALRHLNRLRNDPAAAIDPWLLLEAVAKRALRADVSRDG